jgi:hypothetical protein
MNDLMKGLRLLARDSLGAAKKRRQISTFLKEWGFVYLGKGGWLGFRNRDVVSGLIIEGSPLDTYITTFLLPAFDRLEFVSWSLGERVVNCSLDRDTQEECEQALESYAAGTFKVRSATDLIRYLDACETAGHYPIWVRYICYLWLSDLNTANQYLNDSRRNQLHRALLERFEEVNQFVVVRDTDGVVGVLKKWSAFSQKIFGAFDQTFSAF